MRLNLDYWKVDGQSKTNSQYLNQVLFQRMLLMVRFQQSLIIKDTNEFQTNLDNYCSNCNINCFTNLGKSYDEIPRQTFVSFVFLRGIHLLYIGQMDSNKKGRYLVKDISLNSLVCHLLYPQLFHPLFRININEC